MHATRLTEDAKTILMLCGRFDHRESPDAAKPLSIGQYNVLAEWLRARGMRPEALLTAAGRQMLTDAPEAVDRSRIEQLLSRGPAMAFAVEKWIHSGIWVICRSDGGYPARLKRHLRQQAPPILYGIGALDLLDRGGLAVVGSRNVNAAGEEYTCEVARSCAGQGIQIVSGGARGVDQVAMLAALDSGGTALGILADSLLQSAVAKDYRDHIRADRLTLVSPYSPDAGFSVGNAMGRNKHVYALADHTLVISAEKGRGGTWAGATEEIKRAGGRTVFVRCGEHAPEGNDALIRMGARPFPPPPWNEGLSLRLVQESAAGGSGQAVQHSLFDDVEPGVATPTVEEPAPDDYEGGRRGAAPPADVLTAVLPLILRALQDWRSSQDVAAELEVHRSQLDDWLRRAAAEGYIERRERPVRYRRRGSGPESA